MSSLAKARKAVLANVALYTAPTFQTTRKKRPRKTIERMCELIEELVPAFVAMTGDSASLIDVLERYGYPTDLRHMEAARWIVKSICIEHAAFNDRAGCKTRGFWRLRDEFRE